MPDSNVTPIKAAEWGTSDSSYSRDEFYCGSRSNDGQSITKQVAFPAHVGSQIAVIIQSGQLPYRTIEDFWRDAVHHRLHDLDEMGALDHDTSRRIALWRRQEELDRHDSEIDATERLIKETAAMVEKARGKGDLVLLERVVQQAEAAAVDLHEPWRGMLLEKVAGAKDVVGEDG